LDSVGDVPGSLVIPAPVSAVPGPNRCLNDTIVYEVHVKGFTATHPGVPRRCAVPMRGLAHEAALAHLVDLGVTAVELLALHHIVPESFLVARGLTNYCDRREQHQTLASRCNHSLSGNT
jgi:glycogen operon protein